MDSSPPAAVPSVAPRNPVEAALEMWLFKARWLLAPFYVGLVAGLIGLFGVFARELLHEVTDMHAMSAEDAILFALSLIELTLSANLLVVVMLSGYEIFVSKIDTGDNVDRPNWMGIVDFSGLKLKLLASIVGVSAVALLRAYMRLMDGPGGADDRTLAWLVGITLTFVVSGLLLAVMDFVISRTKHL